MASPFRYSSALPTSMTAWLWRLYLKQPSFHRRQQRNATCAWMHGTSARRKSPQGYGFIPHIRPRGEEKKEIATNPEFKARRWVAELTHSWFNRFRKLIPRYKKTNCSYLALTSLAAALITLNKVISICG